MPEPKAPAIVTRMMDTVDKATQDETSKTMSDAAKVTREDRLAAYQAERGVSEPPLGSKARQWVDLGIGDYRDWERIAQAFADVRAASIAEVTQLKAKLAEREVEAGEFFYQITDLKSQLSEANAEISRKRHGLDVAERQLSEVRAATAHAFAKDVLDFDRKDSNISWEHIERDLAKIAAKYIKGGT